VEFIYVNCMFVILLFGVKLNHVVMEQDFQLNYVVVIHLWLCISFQCEMSGSDHVKDLSVDICYRRALGR
jgi:hypothetical protein